MTTSTAFDTVGNASVPISFTGGGGRVAVDGSGQVLVVSAIDQGTSGFTVGDTVSFTESSGAGEGSFRVASIE